MLGTPSSRRVPKPWPVARMRAGRDGRGRGQMAEDGGPGRGDPLACDAVVVRPAGRAAAARSPGPGPGSMPCAVLHPAAAQRQRCGRPAPGTQTLDQPGGGHDVEIGVPVGQLVEMDLLGRHAVDAALGLGQQPVDRGGTGLGRRGQVAAGDAVGDGAQAAGRGERLRCLDRDPRAGQRRGRDAIRRRPCAGRQRRQPAAPRPAVLPAPGKASSTAAANMSPAMPPSGSRWMWAMPLKAAWTGTT